MRRLVPVLFLAVFTLSSCILATGSQNQATKPSPYDITAFQNAYMLSYFATNPGSPAGASNSPRVLTPFLPSASAETGSTSSRATVPVTHEKFSGTFTTDTIKDYPEPGQNSTFTVAATANIYNGSFTIYDVTVTTTFPASDYRSTYVERYYVADIGTTGSWTVADPIVRFNGTSWVQDQSARASMSLEYDDGSVRTEAMSSYAAGGTGTFYDYSALDPSGSLLDVAAPAATTTDSDVMYSSVVVYTHKPARDGYYWFWKGKGGATIVGVRYYTERANVAADSYVARSVAFERTLQSSGGLSVTNPAGIEAAVLDPSLTGVLAQSVIRQEVAFGLAGSPGSYTATGSALSSSTRMQTRVANLGTSTDFLLSQINSVYASLGAALTDTIYYLP